MEWNLLIEKKPEEGQQCWIHFRYPSGSTGEGYGIWDSGDWFYEVTESGDLYSRSKAIKYGLEAAEVTHWMPLPEAPNVIGKGCCAAHYRAASSVGRRPERP